MKTKVNLKWEMQSRSVKEGLRVVSLGTVLEINIDYMIPTYIEYLGIQFKVQKESTFVISKDTRYNHLQLNANYCEELPFFQPIFNDDRDIILDKENTIDKKIEELIKLNSNWVIIVDYRKNSNEKEIKNGKDDK